MGVAVDWSGGKGNVRSDHCKAPRLHRDLCTVMPTAETHFPFGYFEARVMAARDDTQCCADDNCFCIGGRKCKRAMSELLFDRPLHSAMLQLHTAPLFGRLINDDGVSPEVEPRAVVASNRNGAVWPDGLESFATSPRLACLKCALSRRPNQARLALNGSDGGRRQALSAIEQEDSGQACEHKEHGGPRQRSNSELLARGPRTRC